MDRKQLVVQRAREFFGDRMDDVVHMVRQDRQDLRGWEEPAHVRAVLRRQTQLAGGEETAVSVMESEIGRPAGEPNPGQQREGLGILLEAGANGLEKVCRQRSQELTQEECLGLECVLLLHGRPSLQIHQHQLASVPAFWNTLEDQRAEIELACRGVGRIELYGHPEFNWAGTGVLVNESTLLTTRRIAELFCDHSSGSWQFRPGITAWMDYRADNQGQPSAGYRVRSVIGVHEQYDLALCDVEPPQHTNSTTPTPLAVAAECPPHLEGRPAYLVGYPGRDSRRSESETISRIFRDLYNVKRVQPGQLHNLIQFRDVQLLQHDCTQLGNSSGSCLIDLETHQVLALHVSGRYLENGTAIPLWVLRDDPLFRRAGVTFAQVSTTELHDLTCQLERLARSRYWTEVRNTIAHFHQQAFGIPPGTPHRNS